MDRDDVMSAVQARFAGAAPELANGFAEHTTMGVEAMLTLGLDPAPVLAWSLRHDPVALDERAPVAVIRRAIVDELGGEHWRTVLRRHVERLAGRLDAHLFHGLIRTAHAARALDHHDDAHARAELAAGLAAWAAWAGAAPRDVAPATAVDPRATILESARRGAAAFVATPSIVALHAVTAPMAYLLLAEHLDDATDAVAAAVFEGTHRRHPVPPARTDEGTVPSTGALAALAARWDAHPAKLVEAALRGYTSSGDATFLDAVGAIMAR